MIRSIGFSINRPWTLFQRRHNETVVEPRDEVAQAVSRRRQEAMLQAHKEALRATVIHGGGWYF